VRQLAAALRRPDAIYDWVLTNIVFTPQWGVIQGADGCLQSRVCDLQDTAELLAALLQADRVPVRFVSGVVEVSPPVFAAAMGAFTSVAGAEDAAEDGGMPIAVHAGATGHAIGVLVPDVWVQARLPGGWVAMDAALKPLAFRPPAPLTRIAGVTPATLTGLTAGALTDPSVPSVTGLDSARIQRAVQSWQARIDRYALAQPSLATVIGGMTVAARPGPPPAGPPGRIVSVTAPVTALPASQSETVTVTVLDGGGTALTHLTIPTASLADQRLTLGYVPATAADAQLVATFGGLYQVPPYLLNVLPVLYLNGQPTAVGPAVPMASEQQVEVTFTGPDGFTSTSVHVITAGTFAVVGVSLSQAGPGVVTAREAHIAAALDRARAGQPITLDDVVGETLEDQELEYYALLDSYTQIEANESNVLVSYRPREMLMSMAPVYDVVGSVPVSVSGVGMGMDLRQFIVTVQARSGSATAAATALLNVATMSSAWESGIFQLTQDDPAISTTALLGRASDSGIPIAAITPGDLSGALGHLSLPAADISDIQALTGEDGGRLVLVPETEQTVNGWTGAGWAALAPDGAFDEILAGGLAGGSTTTQTPSLKQLQDTVNEGVPNTVVVGGAEQLARGTALGTGITGLDSANTVLTGVTTGVSVGVQTNNAGKGVAAGTVAAYASGAAAGFFALAVTGAEVGGASAVVAAALPIVLTVGAVLAVGTLVVNSIRNSH
jgi:hypothetical protein